MMDVPLGTPLLFNGVGRHHHHGEIVSRGASGDIHPQHDGDFSRPSRQLFGALDALGVGAGERVATVAWNSYRHREVLRSRFPG